MGWVYIKFPYHLADVMLATNSAHLSSRLRTSTFSLAPMPMISTPILGKSVGHSPKLVGEWPLQ